MTYGRRPGCESRQSRRKFLLSQEGLHELPNVPWLFPISSPGVSSRAALVMHCASRVGGGGGGHAEFAASAAVGGGEDAGSSGVPLKLRIQRPVLYLFQSRAPSKIPR